MIRIQLDKEFNGNQLIQEMRNAGIELYENLIGISAVMIEANRDIMIPTTEEYSQLAQQIADSHSPVFIQPTIQDKLAAAGLSVDELKTALGL
jgi:peptide deformylase